MSNKKKASPSHQPLPLVDAQSLRTLTETVKNNAVEQHFSRLSILLIVLSVIAKGVLIILLFWYLSHVHAAELQASEKIFFQQKVSVLPNDKLSHVIGLNLCA